MSSEAHSLLISSPSVLPNQPDPQTGGYQISSPINASGASQQGVGIGPQSQNAGVPGSSFIAGWPTKPETLPRGDLSSRIYSRSIEIVVALFPVVFLVLAGLAAKLDGQEISSWGDGLIAAAKIVGKILNRFQIYFILPD